MNLQVLAEESGLEIDDVELLLEVFKASVTDSLGKLKEAVASSDSDQIRFALHKIAGSSASLLGLGEINIIAKAGEEALRESKPCDAAAIAARVEAILKRESLI